MNQFQEQLQTCGNCASSEKAPKVDKNNKDEQGEATCRKNLTPNPDDKNIGGVYLNADTRAGECPGWEAKEND